MFRRSHSKAGEEPRYRRTAVALVTSPTIRRPGFCLCNGAGCRLRPGLRLPRPCKPWGAPSPRRARVLFLKARPRGEHAGLSALLPTPELPGGRRGGLGHRPPPASSPAHPLVTALPHKTTNARAGPEPGDLDGGGQDGVGLSHTLRSRGFGRPHLEATYLAQRGHSLGDSDLLLLLQVSPRQPLPLQDLVKSL